MSMGIAAVLTAFLVSLVTVECGVPFVYEPVSASDPTKVALLREALLHAGISPEGIIVKSMFEKWEVVRASYKAVYINRNGQTCFLKWRVNQIIGTQTPALPTCENVATGSGPNYDPNVVVIQPKDVDEIIDVDGGRHAKVNGHQRKQ